jgi:hypothetical protein
VPFGRDEARFFTAHSNPAHTCARTPSTRNGGTPGSKEDD